MPEYALEAALEIKEDTVTTTLKSCGTMSTSSGQGCRGGALRAGMGFGSGKEMGRRLRQLLLLLLLFLPQNRGAGDLLTVGVDPLLGPLLWLSPFQGVLVPMKESGLLHQHSLRRRKWPPVCGVGSCPVLYMWDLSAQGWGHTYRDVHKRRGPWALEN